MGKENTPGADVLADGIAGAATYTEYKETGGREWKRYRFNPDVGYSYFLGAHAVRSFPGGWELPADLSATECGHMYRCAMMLQPRTNMLVKHHKNYDRPLTIEGLAKELGISTRQCQRFIKRMEDRRIVKRQDGHIYVSPIFFIRGRMLTWHLYTLFSDDLDAFLPQWVIDRFNGDVNA